jgi:hypothetical protein
VANLYRPGDGCVPERNKIYRLDRRQLKRRWPTRALQPPTGHISVGPIGAPHSEQFLHRTDNPGVGHNKDNFGTQRRSPEPLDGSLDALVESAQLFTTREGLKATAAPQVDFPRPPGGYFCHREAVPVANVMLAQGRFEGHRPVIAKLLGNQFCAQTGSSQI